MTEYTLSNMDAERAVLGSILLDSNSYNQAAERLRIEDFALEADRIIFRCMGEIIAANGHIDTLTLTEELTRLGELEKVGDVAYIADLFRGLPERPSIRHWLDIVKEKAQSRKLIAASRLAIERSESGERAPDVASGLMATALDVCAHSSRQTAQLPAEFMGSVKHELEEQSAMHNRHGLIGLHTGLSDLDELTGGLRRGELVVVGARPGVGKSALATQITIANARAGNATEFFSLEMSKEDIGRRFLASVTNVGAQRLRHPHLLNAADWREITNGLNEIVGWPVAIDDSGSFTIHELLARAKLAVTERKTSLVIVDYLQLVRGEGRDIREQVGNVANALRLHAKSENVAVVLLSQLRRPQRFDDQPTLIDLKESGDIEAHAHLVVLLHTPIGVDGRPTGEDLAIIAKHRNGGRGSIKVMFNGQKMAFFARTNYDRAVTTYNRINQTVIYDRHDLARFRVN